MEEIINLALNFSECSIWFVLLSKHEWHSTGLFCCTLDSIVKSFFVVCSCCKLQEIFHISQSLNFMIITPKSITYIKPIKRNAHIYFLSNFCLGNSFSSFFNYCSPQYTEDCHINTGIALSELELHLVPYLICFLF